ncbi:MAG: protein kinase [Candidatus Margulisiibacteriota bacterium]
MPIKKIDTEDFLKEFDDGRYPGALLEDYEAMECLSLGKAGETLLVRDRATREQVVVKCYTDPSLLSHTTESELLKKLHHRSLPSFVGEYQNDKMHCVVREYAQGIPLNKYAVKHLLSQCEVIDLVLQLCDILIYLHGQTPPVIHRDIKPQNIIVDDTGKMKLIDFGISRIYNESAQNDTVFFGTQEFAPPEQYGFSQTDNRSDIFSLGVLLCWLLTGKTDLKNAESHIKNKRLWAIIKKCTSFAPKDRYRSVQEVRRALLNADGHRQKKRCQVACAVFALLLAASFGFAAGRFTDILSVSGGDPGVIFSEPLIESAVRLQLDKNEKEVITEADLFGVTELYAFGSKVAADEEGYKEIAADFVENNDSVQRGSITSLTDLSRLENLKSLSFAYQNISDLEGLSPLAHLEHIELKHNPIKDLSPLSGAASLTGLFIFDTEVSDLTCLGGCLHLSHVDAGYTHITSIAALQGLDSLEVLRLDKAPLESIDQMKGLEMLRKIYLADTHVSDLTPLLELSRLSMVEVSENMRDAAEAVTEKASFEIQYQK